MKNVINYYYNLYPQNIYQKEEKYYFYIDKIKYYFVKYTSDIKKANETYALNLKMLQMHIYVHSIIINKDEQIITYIKNEPYILMQINTPEYQITIQDIINFSQIKIETNTLNWNEIWSIKNDYLEYEINMLGQNHKLIRESFSYYIGLAETAITLAGENKEYCTLTYSHYRMSQNSLDFYNPLNIKYDTKVRDAAEYFKTKFFNNYDITNELQTYFNTQKLSIYEYKMFFSRMMYPAYYFDVYEKIIENKKEDKTLLPIIKKNKEYETLLQKIYFYYKSFLKINQIEWLEIS